MNSQLIQQGRAAYRAGDFSAAAQMLSAAKTPDEIMGEADHLRGNALMHLGMHAEVHQGVTAKMVGLAHNFIGGLCRREHLGGSGKITRAVSRATLLNQLAIQGSPLYS